MSWGGCLTGASIAVLPQSLEPRVDLQGRAASLLDRLLPVLLAKIWWALWSCLLPRLRLGSSIVLLFNPCGRVYVYDHPLFGFWMNHRPLRSTSCQPFFDHGRPRSPEKPLIAVTARICALYRDFSARSDGRFWCIESLGVVALVETLVGRVVVRVLAARFSLGLGYSRHGGASWPGR